MPGLMQANGAQDDKPTKSAPIFTNRFFVGLCTNRNPLRAPVGLVPENFYRVGATDAMFGGTNVELSNRLTPIRRPGNTAGLTSLIYGGNLPDVPLNFISFHESTGQVRIFADTVSAPYLVTASNFIPMYSKGIGAGQSFYQGVGQSLYFTDLAEQQKWLDLGNASVSINTVYNITATQANGPNGTKWLSSSIFNTSGGVSFGAKVSASNSPTSGAIIVGKGTIGGGVPTQNSANTAVIYCVNSLVPGMTVTIANTTNGSGIFNGTWNVSSASGTLFTFALTHAKITKATESGGATATVTSVVNTPGNGLANVTSNSISTGGVATIVAQNSFAAGQTVTVSNTANSSGIFNNTWTVLSANANQFTFNITASSQADTADTGFVIGTWNWGIAAPTNKPGVKIIQIGSATVPWTAACVFSTMGLVDETDATGIKTIQQLTSVNASGSNATQFGTTGNGQPAWNGPGQTTTDSGVTWLNVGQLTYWTENTTYASEQPIYDPTSGGIYVKWGAGSGTSVAVRPNFTGIVGNGSAGFVKDKGGFTWGCVGNAQPARNNGKDCLAWQPAHVYATFDAAGSTCLEPIALSTTPGALLPSQPIYLQEASTGGTSGTGYSPAWSSTPGFTTAGDGDMIWTDVCSTVGPIFGHTWATGTQYTGWVAGNNTFSVVKDTQNNFQVCVVGGKSGGSQPNWLNGDGNPMSYGDTITDGTVTWVCVGPKFEWATGILWYLPAVGFFPPNGAQPYGGPSVLDSNSNIQFVVATGKSAGSAPSWATTPGSKTTESGGAPIWVMTSAYIANSLSFTSGYGYCFAFKARSLTDNFSPLPLGGGLTPPGLLNLNGTVNSGTLGVPTGSADGSVSTASPIFQMPVGTNSGSIMAISGVGSIDPQVDTIDIYRTFDGGQTFFWLTSIPNPAVVNGLAGTWTAYDNVADLLLNTLVVAPLAHSNDQPPAGLVNIVQHFQRIWGSVGNTVYCSEGPLVGGASQPPGNGYTAFNPAQYWTFSSPVTRIVPVTNALLVFTTSDTYWITGGPNVYTMFGSILVPGLGLPNYNAMAVSGGWIFMLTSDGQCIMLDPSMGITEVGQKIGDKIAAIDGTKAYVTYHTQGSNDKALFVGSPADGGWYRCNPNLAPDAAIGGPAWSPLAVVAGGFNPVALQSVEVKPGQKALLIGSSAASQPILVRDSTYSVFSDNGTSYGASVIIGSIVLANPGQLAELDFITAEYQRVGTSPKMGVLLDEVSGPFEDLSGYTFASGPVLTLTAAANSSGGNTVYTGTITNGAANYYLGQTFTVTGFTNSGNNIVSALCVASTSTTLTLVNAGGVLETHAGVATPAQIPPQDPPVLYGTTTQPVTLYSNRYYFAQTVVGNTGQQPLPTCCRHMQVQVNFGNDTVENEMLTMTIYGFHYNEA